MGAIWDFSDFKLVDLLKIEEHCISLNSYGIEQDDDMMAELRAEIKRKGGENSI